MNHKTVSTQPSTEKAHVEQPTTYRYTEYQYGTACNLPKYWIPVPTVYGNARNLPIHRMPVPIWYCWLRKNTPLKTSGKHISQESWRQLGTVYSQQSTKLAFYPADHHSLHVTALNQPSCYLLVWSQAHQEHGFSTDLCGRQ